MKYYLTIEMETIIKSINVQFFGVGLSGGGSEDR